MHKQHLERTEPQCYRHIHWVRLVVGSQCPLAPQLCSKQALSDAAQSKVMAWPVSGNSPVIEGPPWYNHPRNNIFIKSKDHKNIELSMICASTATSFEQVFYHKHASLNGTRLHYANQLYRQLQALFHVNFYGPLSP